MLAHGDLIRDARGGRANSRLVYHFSDGSLQDETAVSSQRGSIQLMSDHFVRKSPTFERPRAMTIDRPTGHVVVRDKNEHGGEKVEDEHMELPPALANGPIITVLKNVRCDALPPSVSLIVGTPKPRS